MTLSPESWEANDIMKFRRPISLAMECEKFPGKTGATSEGRVGGDGDGGDAHDDVRHGHVDQVQPRVDPQLLGSNSSEN